MRRKRSLGIAPLLPAWLAGSIAAVETDDPVVSLTFDDGPDPNETRRIRSVLGDHGARATFFVLAGQAERFPDEVRRTRAEGHEIGLHGGMHVRLTEAPTADVVRSIRDGRRRVERVARDRVRLFRPPFGALDLRSYVIARASGMQVVVWTADAQDWLDLEIDEMATRALNALSTGGILLLHDRHEPEPRQVRPFPRFDRALLVAEVLARVAAKGWGVVPVGELLAGHRPRRVIWFRG